MNSWSKGTQQQYSPHINRWLNIIVQGTIDPFDSSVNQGAEFLAEIVRILRGIFKQRPSLPHYIVTYDVAKVLQYISNPY